MAPEHLDPKNKSLPFDDEMSMEMLNDITNC